LTAALALAFGIAACAEQPTATLPVFDADMSFVANGKNAAVALSGAEEVPARDTKARGTATFHLSADGQSMSYRLNVANIENVVQAHIHIGAAGANGPFIVFLYPFSDPAGRVDGVLATGTFTADDFVNLLEGEPMEVLVAAMRTGNAYVNVHTNDGIDPPNTGPGDFPGGEVRGQIR
jgi:hypothetical protein